MNMAHKKIYALIFSAVVVTTSVHGNDNMEEITESVQTAVAWYKKPSVQVAAVITTAAAGFAFAVRMGKVAIPAFLATLIATKFVQESNPVEAAHTDDVQDSSPTPVIVGNNQSNVQNDVQQSENSALAEMSAQNQAKKHLADKLEMWFTWAKNIKVPTLDQYKETVVGISNEDLQHMNEDLNK